MLGSIRQIIDDANNSNIENIYRYGSWGELSSPFSKIENITNFYTYTSREFAENNLYYYRSRYYMQNAGIFIQKDKIQFIDYYDLIGLMDNVSFINSLSLSLPSNLMIEGSYTNIGFFDTYAIYSYCSMNPINCTDPYGYQAKMIVKWGAKKLLKCWKIVNPIYCEIKFQICVSDGYKKCNKLYPNNDNWSRRRRSICEWDVLHKCDAERLICLIL